MRDIKSWIEIEDAMEKMETMSCKPNFLRLKDNYITDENQSVKWNKEQVEKNHKDYDEEVKRLNTLKNNYRDEVYADIYAYIQNEVGYDINTKQAEMIWNYAYCEGHSGGISEIRVYLNEIIYLVSDILEENKKKANPMKTNEYER